MPIASGKTKSKSPSQIASTLKRKDGNEISDHMPDNRSDAVVQRKLQAMADIYVEKQNIPGVVQRVKIDKQNVSSKVFKAYKSLNPIIQLCIDQTDPMDRFFNLPEDKQIHFFNTLEKSLPILTMLIQQQASPKAITGARKIPQQSMLSLWIMFYNMNPDFINQSLRLFLNQPATFNFYVPDGKITLMISSLAALREPSPVAMIEHRSVGRIKAPERPKSLSIEEVMAKEGLDEFIAAQQLFQTNLNQMDGLNSAGLEFEFASFASPGTVYTKDEIIPSHKTMAQTGMFGSYFKLPWKLESDSYNTLELVAPPFVYPRSEKGNIKQKVIKEKIEKETHTIAHEAENETGTLSQVGVKLAGKGLGTGWRAETPYENFLIVKNKKSGGDVYSQLNISLFPKEIGEMLEYNFSRHALVTPNILEPLGLALKIREVLNAQLERSLSKKSIDTKPVKNAIAIFARYASNAMAIPSMRHRQETKERKDTMPTQVKETLGVWVKTDALNLLQPVLSETIDSELFTTVLKDRQESVLTLFRNLGEQLIKQEDTNALLAKSLKPEPIIDRDLLIKKFKDLKNQFPLMNVLDCMTMAKSQLAPPEVERPDPVEKMKQYVKLMLTEARVFIERALLVKLHSEIDPTETTEEFLEEEYGSGKGVRKGTYLKGVPTSKGKMYVTEIR